MTLNGASLQYDASDRRIKNAAGKSFLFDGANATQELSGSTVTANIWTGGMDEIFQRSDSNGTVVPLRDGLGSTLALTDANGNIQTTYTYAPFGNTSVSGQASANPAQFTGRENDGNGLYYYRARYYNSVQGRFISEDPARVGGNFYAYAFNSPTNLVDPSGLGPLWDGFKSLFKPTPTIPAPKAPCNCPGLEPFLNYMRANYGGGPTTQKGNCAQAVKTGLSKGAGFTYWTCDALNCGQGLLDRGFTDVTTYGGSDSDPLRPGDITVMQPSPELIAKLALLGKTAYGHMAVWDGSQWISDFSQGHPGGEGDGMDGFQIYKNTLNVTLPDFKYYRYPCGCSN